MTSVDTELVLVALAAMLSPTTLFLSVLALVVGERPKRTALWFYLGAFGATLVVGVVAAFVLGNAAASPKPSTPKTWVAIVDVVAGRIDAPKRDRPQRAKPGQDRLLPLQ